MTLPFLPQDHISLDRNFKQPFFGLYKHEESKKYVVKNLKNNVIVSPLLILNQHVVANNFKAKLFIISTWRDFRLNFINLNAEKNSLQSEELDLIWTPVYLLRNRIDSVLK